MDDTVGRDRITLTRRGITPTRRRSAIAVFVEELVSIPGDGVRCWRVHEAVGFFREESCLDGQSHVVSDDIWRDAFHVGHSAERIICRVIAEVPKQFENQSLISFHVRFRTLTEIASARSRVRPPVIAARARYAARSSCFSSDALLAHCRLCSYHCRQRERRTALRRSRRSFSHNIEVQEVPHMRRGAPMTNRTLRTRFRLAWCWVDGQPGLPRTEESCDEPETRWHGPRAS